MQAGYTLYECACGDSYQTDRVSPLGHTYVDSVCVRCGQESLFGPGIVKPIVPVITGIGTTSTFSANGQVLEATIVQTYDYIYNGGSLSQMTVVTTVDGEEAGTDTLYFAYASGPMSVTYNGTVYYYVTNLQGDVVAILNTSGTAVVQYTYDAWGNVLSITGSMADTLGQMNPLRYRGYVYDTETGLYYLQSRYYDPKVGRFINADAFASTGQGVLGNNMFAYCGNNPVSREDGSGDFWEIVVGAAIGGAIAGAIIGAVSHIVSCGMSGTEVTVSGLLGAPVTGAVTGAIGAVGGAIGGTAAIAASIGVGAISGVVTAVNTEGTITEKIIAGLTAGVVAGFGTYLGTRIPVATDNAFTIGFTSFSGGLYMGAQTEMVNVATQQIVSKTFSSEQNVNSVGSQSYYSFHVRRPVSRSLLA